MRWPPKIRSRLQSDWFIAFFLLGIFWLMAGYKYGWDDQHLEIPLLKALIDNSLYPNDYYVTSLKNNFLSYFYPLLSRLITIEQIPMAYGIFYHLSRYFLFFWMYRIWLLITKEKPTAVLCVLILMSLGRPSEFFYRTFSHQEFALAIIFSGLYFFYRERFSLASCLWGIAANFHAVYSLFPMIYLTVYFLGQRQAASWQTIGRSLVLFSLGALPIVLWAVVKRFLIPEGVVHDPTMWLPIYRLACPPNFIFDGVSVGYLFKNPSQWLLIAQKEVMLFILYLFHLLFNDHFRQDKKSRAIIWGAFLLMALSYLFTYIFPSRLILDLNIVRNAQFLSFVLIGYTVLFTLDLIDHQKSYLAASGTVMLSIFVFDSHLITMAVVGMSLLLLWGKSRKQYPRHTLPIIISGVLSLTLLFWGWVIYKAFSHLLMTGYIFLAVAGAEIFLFSLFLQLTRIEKYYPSCKRLLIILPLISLVIYRGYGHFKLYTQETQAKTGFWKLQRDWEDMQKYVRDNTAKTATILAPHDMEMGGFRIFSERTLVACDRDIGIIGFDYSATLECLRRLHDIEPLRVILKESIEPQAMLNWVVKYRVDYIVFMRYYTPKPEQTGAYKKIYENDNFTLFKVRPEILKYLALMAS